MVTTRNNQISVNGSRLEYTMHGQGEPVLLIHGSIFADAFAPLIAEQSFVDHYQVVSFHRRGFAGSDRAAGPFSLAQQAADCRSLLQALGIERVHIVGHSYGGTIALQLAVDAAPMVHSLALLEPALIPMTPGGERWFTDVVKPAIDRYLNGNPEAAIDIFLRGVVGPDYRETVSQVLPPDAWQQAMIDAPTFFEVELPALGEWRFGPDEARRISQPILAVLGAESAAITPVFAEGHELLPRWFPQTESSTLPGATHALQMANPAGVATGLGQFFRRHPLPPHGG